MEQAKSTCLNFIQGLLEFAPSEDMSLPGVGLSLGDDPDVGGRWLGGFFAQVIQLLANLGRLGVVFGEVVGQELALGFVSPGRFHEQGLADVLGYEITRLLARNHHDAEPAHDVPGSVELGHLNAQRSGFLGRKLFLQEKGCLMVFSHLLMVLKLQLLRV